MPTSLPLAATPSVPLAGGATCSLPALIDRARSRLAEARTSAEVLEARAAAKAALHYAKLLEAANETQADCLLLIKRAEIRMADEIDAAQQSGEVAPQTARRVRTMSELRTSYPTLRRARPLAPARRRVARVARCRRERRRGADSGRPRRGPRADQRRHPARGERWSPPHAVHRRERVVHAARVHRGGARVPRIDRPRSGDLRRARRKPSGRRASSPATTTACATSGTAGSGSTRRTRSRTSPASSTSCSPRSPPAGDRGHSAHPQLHRHRLVSRRGRASAPPSVLRAGGSGSSAPPARSPRQPRGRPSSTSAPSLDRFRATFGGFGFIR